MSKKRPLGQNFLIDEDIAREIVELAGIRPGGTVLEIGPGKGILTNYLLGKAGTFSALEIDPRLIAGLEKKSRSNPKLNLILGDALKFDYSSIGSDFQVVSNLPYYAATHIMKRLIHYRSCISDMTLMLQKEVVDRLTASPGTKEYGSLTIFTQFNCQVERLLEIGKASFSPPPKIKSALIKLTPLVKPSVEVDDQNTFFKIVHASFFHQRKMLKNNLKLLEKQLHLDENKIESSGIDLNRRAETLTLQDFATISNLAEPIKEK
jgi:16S rRNA (adenine1518-N6/adenine1519-N6)-dimethyltransferase